MNNLAFELSPISDDLLPDKERVVSKAYAIGYTILNAIPSAAEFSLAMFTGNVSALVDGGGGIIDAGFGGAQLLDANKTPEVQEHRQRRQYQAITLASIGAASLVLAEINGFNFGVSSSFYDKLTFASSIVSSTVVFSYAAKLYKNMKEKYGSWHQYHKTTKVEQTEETAVRHVIRKDVPVAALALAGTALRVYGNSKGIDYSGLEYGIGLSSATWAAWVFRPTKENIQRSREMRLHETAQ